MPRSTSNKNKCEGDGRDRTNVALSIPTMRELPSIGRWRRRRRALRQSRTGEAEPRARWVLDLDVSHTG